MDNIASDSPRKTAKPFFGSFFWIVDVILVLLVIALIFLNPLEFMALNYLYHLGQQKKWDEAHRQLPKVRESYRSNPRYSRIQLETLLHLAKNSEALALIQSKNNLMREGSGEAIGFQQLAAFGLVLMDKEDQAAAIFSRHTRSGLSRDMKSLIGDLKAKRYVDAARVPEVLNRVEDQMTYPDLPSAIVRYLFAKAFIQEGDSPGAIDLLEQINNQYPYEYAIQRSLGIAYLDAGRFDLANIHLSIARRQLQDRNLYPYSADEEREFEQTALQHAFRYSASRVPSDFWRLLRGMTAIFPRSQYLSSFPVNPHPFSAAETWEWVQYEKARSPQQWVKATNRTLSQDEKAMLAALDRATSEKDNFRALVQPALPQGATSATLLQTTWINRNETGLVHNGQTTSFTIPAASGYIDSGLVLCQIRGSLREGIPGGCEVHFGQDDYYVHLEGKPQWYAFPLPVLTTRPVPLVFRFNSDSVAGYTARDDAGDRNLYIMRVLACYVEKQ